PRRERRTGPRAGWRRHDRPRADPGRPVRGRDRSSGCGLRALRGRSRRLKLHLAERAAPRLLAEALDARLSLAVLANMPAAALHGEQERPLLARREVLG